MGPTKTDADTIPLTLNSDFATGGVRFGKGDRVFCDAASARRLVDRGLATYAKVLRGLEGLEGEQESEGEEFTNGKSSHNPQVGWSSA